MSERVENLGRSTSERQILQKHIREGRQLDTEVSLVTRPERETPVSEAVVGLFRDPKSREVLVADVKTLQECEEKGMPLPSFLEAGPRAKLRHDPHNVRAAVVTTGGLAPGLNSVIHSIVVRHSLIYQLNQAKGRVLGVYDSFRGLCDLADNCVVLDPAETEKWLSEGGCKLGCVRYYPGGARGDETIAELADVITRNLVANGIDILYVIGGDGSLRVAHQIALRNPTISVVGIPKTMDNDVLWVWQSFGFDTAVEQATGVVNTLCSEAESARRVCVVELFGAESGFVAANAALASGHVRLVLIPEVFDLLDAEQTEVYLDSVVEHLRRVVRGITFKPAPSLPYSPHAVAIVAEGVGAVLKQKGFGVKGKTVDKTTFVQRFMELIAERVHDARSRPVQVFLNQPRHHIRAVPANAHDQIYCDRLGALAVDAALAGYTDCMVSQWLTEFVLVPLSLVEMGQKSIPVKGMFWKQVVSATGQPLSAAEMPS